jgi:hypothetical protein
LKKKVDELEGSPTLINAEINRLKTKEVELQQDLEQVCRVIKAKEQRLAASQHHQQDKRRTSISRLSNSSLAEKYKDHPGL